MHPRAFKLSRPVAAWLSLASAAGCADYDSINVDGVSREFLLHLPPGDPPPDGWPLVIAYHGAYSTPEATEGYSRLSALADDEGFAVVYPKGKQRLWNDGRIRDIHDDVGFTAVLIDHLVDNAGVDEARVFATGISNGGFMSHRVGCDLADKISAIAPVAGTMSNELAAECDPEQPVSVMVFLGTDDTLVPYEGGKLGGKLTGGLFGTMKSAQDSALFWSELGECGELVEEEIVNVEEDGTALETVRYTSCMDGAEVVLHTIAGGGHTWPGSQHVKGLGTVSEEIDASAAMWTFFMAHVRQ